MNAFKATSNDIDIVDDIHSRPKFQKSKSEDQTHGLSKLTNLLPRRVSRMLNIRQETVENELKEASSPGV
jgi:hypothetical protein